MYVLVMIVIVLVVLHKGEQREPNVKHGVITSFISGRKQRVITDQCSK